MKIEVYAICYNEELMLPYFIRHYSQFADIIIYDNYSTDKSEEIAINAGAKVIKYDTNNQIRDDIYLSIKNNCWKSSKADWVIVCDVDEFVYHIDLVDLLENTNTMVYDLEMYNMYSLNFPTTDGQIYDEVKYGVPFVPSSGRSNKSLLFKPSKVREINYTPGCHTSSPRGDEDININRTSDIKFLHMRFLSKEYVIHRNSKYRERLSDINKKNGWGYDYLYSSEKISLLFDEEYEKIKKII